jgi:cell division septum initiation protein DivIVA
MNARQRLVRSNSDGAQDLAQIGTAADRAGAMVTEQVRSIIEAAEKRAEEIRSSAERDADEMRKEAVAAAHRILDRLDAIEGPLGDLVTSLRREADKLTSDARR